MLLADNKKIIELYEQCLQKHCSKSLNELDDLAITIPFAILLLKNVLNSNGNNIEEIVERTKRDYEIVHGE